MEKIKEKLHIGSKHKESKEESGMTSVEHGMTQPPFTPPTYS
jgi:hypothetical protein